MAPYNVLDLVSKNACNLRHVAGPLQDAAIDVDEPAWQRESVDHVRIHDLELPLQIRPRRPARDPLTKRVDIVFDHGVLHHRQLGTDLLRLLLPHLHFLLRGYSTTGE